MQGHVPIFKPGNGREALKIALGLLHFYHPAARGWRWFTAAGSR
jgi:hypothetical protein